jgi:predicted site-specific integrase-resolvase
MYLTIQEFADSQKPPVSRKTVERWIREDKLTYELTVSKRKRITGVKKV